jgi:hypothetical protein
MKKGGATERLLFPFLGLGVGAKKKEKNKKDKGKRDVFEAGAKAKEKMNRQDRLVGLFRRWPSLWGSLL